MKQKRALLGVVMLVAAAIVLFAVWRVFTPAGTEGAKTVQVEVIHGDGSSRTFQLKTEEAYLGPALVEGSVVEDNQSIYGLYILTADGETADEGKQQWWKVTRAGERVDTGADTTPIADGDQFELTLTTGYD